MSGLVLELQREILDSNTKTSDLLRKALVVAKKLNIKDIEEWINNELNGYKTLEEIPDYRELQGEIKFWSSYREMWCPYIISDPQKSKIYTTRSIDQSISEMEFLDDKSTRNNVLAMSYPQKIENMLMESMEVKYRPQLIINRVHVRGIINIVRNIILDWTLKLENDGILGEGMTFSQEEKETATHKTFNINTHIENMTDSQLQQGTQGSSQKISNVEINFESVKNFITEVESNFDKLEVDDISKSDLKAQIDTIKSQLGSTRPNEIIIKESLFSIKSILEKVIIGTISSGLLALICKLLG